ncbi:YgfY protein [Candidatus Rhodobacter oscarellae]|uniref:FAD assembly factor SdhE n=2 Tax=Candidatus Rhodobacter oscarellae TaxID=1675527 RepID=A0A0J9E0W4_9RHOB|nr:YgfY protein [Candidatus Rhodobacter lobularis]
MTVELPEHRLKRLKMRSMRRGIKEMDVVLSAFAEDRLAVMNEADLQTYDRLLGENDQDIYSWVLGRQDPPDQFAALMQDISAHARGR